MTVNPLYDHVVIKAAEEESQTASGIVIPDTAREKHTQKGTVIAIGPGRLDDKGNRVPMSVKVGDVVLFKKYGPDEVKMRDESGKEVEYLIGKEEDILAVIS